MDESKKASLFVTPNKFVQFMFGKLRFNCKYSYVGDEKEKIKIELKDYCQAANNMTWDEIKAHKNNCKFERFGCPFRCDKYVKQKDDFKGYLLDDVEEHVLNDCPLSKTPCEKCNIKFFVSDIDDHDCEENLKMKMKF